MPIQTGTYTIADLSRNVFATTTVEEFGLDNLNAAIQNDLAIHNERTTEMLREIAQPSTERSTVYGTNAETEMHRVDEFGRGPTQKVRRGDKVEFPLDKFQHAVGWTAEYLRHATVQDMALATISARQAHLRLIQSEIKLALFNPTNYSYVDRLVDGNTLAVKRLANADGGSIPSGPNGESFDGSTHTHYLASDWTEEYDTGTRNTAIADLVQDVIEHGHTADFRIYINRAQESDFRALPDFTGLIYPNTIPAPGGTELRGVGVLDITRMDNRLIGYFQGIPVWTKPWVPANYVLAFSAGDPGKPLRYRTPAAPRRTGLFLAGQIFTYPLQAEYMEAYMGFGVLTRTNGAILYLGGDTYTAPSF